jgi:pyrroloquinoline-quinone synthase
MHPDQVHDAIAAALDGRRLLEHPFYRRWEAGELTDGELAAYAEQYRHVEQALPAVLRTVTDQLPDGPARDLVRANLADEEGVPEPHVTLFESFATAVGAQPSAPAGPAATALTELQRSTAATDPVAALAVVAAYEIQAGAIATSKAAGLTEHYGLDEHGTRFWDVHATMEADHATWSLDALALLCRDADDVAGPAGAGAAAWWAFLDERDADRELAPA